MTQLATPESDDITSQRQLLDTYRRTLNHLCIQAAQHGGEVFAPPAVASGIAEARQNIAAIKAYIRSKGAAVDDYLNDLATSEVAAPPTFEPPPTLQVQQVDFNPQALWHVAVSNNAQMVVALANDGSLEGQTIINEQGEGHRFAGQWAYDPGQQILQLRFTDGQTEGLSNILIMGEQDGSFYGQDHELQYLFTPVPDPPEEPAEPKKPPRRAK